jgi:hypothetical protein
MAEDWKPKSNVLQSLLAGRALTPAPNKQAARAICASVLRLGRRDQYARLCSPKDIIRARVAKAWRATFDNIRDEVRRGWVVQQSYRHAGPGGAAACPSHRRKAPFGSMGVASIAVVNQLVRRLVPREGFHDLLPDPHHRWMIGHSRSGDAAKAAGSPRQTVAESFSSGPQGSLWPKFRPCGSAETSSTSCRTL